jgi:hypothetical protein
VYEKHACQLAVVNMADVNNDNDGAYSDSSSEKMSTDLLNQIYNLKIKKNKMHALKIQ